MDFLLKYIITFIAEHLFVLMVILFALVSVPQVIRNYKATCKVGDQRKAFIENSIDEIGGKVTNISKSKVSECPYKDELGLTDNTQNIMYVPYKVMYNIDQESKTGWAIFQISMVLVTDTITKDQWIMRF